MFYSWNLTAIGRLYYVFHTSSARYEYKVPTLCSLEVREFVEFYQKSGVLTKCSGKILFALWICSWKMFYSFFLLHNTASNLQEYYCICIVWCLFKWPDFSLSNYFLQFSFFNYWKKYPRKAGQVTEFRLFFGGNPGICSWDP